MCIRDSIKAEKYRRDWSRYLQETEGNRAGEGAADRNKPRDVDAGSGRGRSAEAKKEPMPPDRDLALETLVQVLTGDILVQWHCYEADDMIAALEVADEFGFAVRSFHHALDAYKIRDLLVQRQVAVTTWASWYGFKMEAYDGIPENMALVHQAGGRAVVHSDSPNEIQILNQEAAKALTAGQAAGIPVTEADALRWITANPAWVLGIDDQVGTLEVGKRADVVIWSENPLSVYARAEKVFIDGHLIYDLSHPAEPWSDFEIGLRSADSATEER